jgi:hypothetical protein
LRQIIDIPVEQIKPDPNGVFQAQGIPPGTSPAERVQELYESAEERFFQLCAPMGIQSGISIEKFSRVYTGNGMNETDTPLEHIFPRASHLALFAFTLGEKISSEIEQLLQNKNLALGYMLDAVASYCTDKAAEAAQTIYLKQLREAGQADESTRVLLYSPGYCGWHVSGQKKLFEYLEPGEIGIHLKESFLMIPLKSISGVLVAGAASIHHFANHFPCCAHCPTHNCRERIKPQGKTP